MKKSLDEYFKAGNIYITTSGHYSTNALKYCIDEIGSERIMFSIVFPPVLRCFPLSLPYFGDSFDWTNDRIIRMRRLRKSSIRANGGKPSTTAKNTKTVPAKSTV